MNVRQAPIRGQARELMISELFLDSDNPRLPESYRGAGQEDLAVVLEMGFDAFAVAQSITDNGFFLGEPLLVIVSDSGKWIVVEGNRRLTALIGLTYENIRSQFTEPERWEELAGRSPLHSESRIPVIVHSDRQASHAEVARAHVVGKLQWRPYMQARFIAARVAEDKTLAEVAELIGITKSKAADLYRDQAVVAQAAELGLPAAEIEKAFSVLTVALGNTKLRSHIGAPLGSQLTVDAAPIPDDKVEEFEEVVSWVFGDEQNEAVINDSRQMSQLGNVVASGVGLKALRAGSTLEEAKQKVAQTGLDPRDRALNRLRAGKNALLAASDDLSDLINDEDVVGAVEDVEAAVEALRSVLDEAGRSE